MDYKKKYLKYKLKYLNARKALVGGGVEVPAETDFDVNNYIKSRFPMYLLEINEGDKDINEKFKQLNKFLLPDDETDEIKNKYFLNDIVEFYKEYALKIIENIKITENKKKKRKLKEKNKILVEILVKDLPEDVKNDVLPEEVKKAALELEEKNEILVEALPEEVKKAALEAEAADESPPAPASAPPSPPPAAPAPPADARAVQEAQEAKAAADAKAAEVERRLKPVLTEKEAKDSLLYVLDKYL